MGDVGADDRGDRGSGIEENQRGNAKGAGADRGKRNQRSEHDAGQDGQPPDLGEAQIIEMAGSELKDLPAKKQG